MTDSTSNTDLLNINNLQIKNSQVVLIYTEWNTKIIQELKEGSKRILSKFPQIEILEIQVPGAVEIPFTIATLHRQKQADAYIALGCVIRGETPHFDYVCQSVTQGITELNCKLTSPTIFGVLTVNTIEQAYERLGGVHGHKGEESAIAALKMMSLNNQLNS